ncbi:nap1-binding protein 2 [Acrodontium crateriforme]|uniref:Nap1-binding protein 2 n=1 Tax=Acrodontium crateriforme TaxID=150365 RepID=A0AAQ3M4G1_9PEZI|nr:nap1-binding protein 2 [Acrodontium crateriforme]
MAEVLAPPMATPSPSPHNSRPESPDLLNTLPRPREPRSQARERIPSYAHNRLSSYSQRTSRSRTHSNVFPAFHSTLPYALVRDFAYPASHIMHYGAPPEPPSGSTTPGSEWNTSRRGSDPTESIGRGEWTAGPWGGDGVLLGDQEAVDPLPATSFGDDESLSSSKRKHRKSKSYANISDCEGGRGRRHESGGQQRRSRVSDDFFQFSNQLSDPAGRDTLRNSRLSGTHENGNRRDSHFAATLPSRSFHTSQTVDPDSYMPLDSEIPQSPSLLRQSIGPEDEELFAGESLALYSFEPENPNELRLTEGQHILVSYRHGQGWLVAEDKDTGEQGLVPEEYVRLLSEIPNYDPETRRFVNVEVDSEMADDLDDSTEELSEVHDGNSLMIDSASEGHKLDGEISITSSHEGYAGDR